MICKDSKKVVTQNEKFCFEYLSLDNFSNIVNLPLNHQEQSAYIVVLNP